MLYYCRNKRAYCDDYCLQNNTFGPSCWSSVWRAIWYPYVESGHSYHVSWDKLELSDLPPISPLKIKDTMKNILDSINSIEPIPECYPCVGKINNQTVSQGEFLTHLDFSLWFNKCRNIILIHKTISEYSLVASKFNSSILMILQFHVHLISIKMQLDQNSLWS